jgi:hypothetical protein
MLKVKIEAVLAARASVLGERQAMSVSQPPRSSEASDTTLDSLQLKFPGRFTSGS